MSLFKKHLTVVKLKEILAYINYLKNNPFSGWSEAEEGAYLTACLSIEKKIESILNNSD